MAEEKGRGPGVYDMPRAAGSTGAPEGAPKNIGVYDRPARTSRVPMTVVWVLIVLALILLAVYLL